MAQTRRKRQTKHRGNAAGMVESRGRTGRKPTAEEKSGKPRDLVKEREKLLDKRDRPPTWRGAFIKAMFATIVMMLIVIIVLHQSNQAIGLFPIVLVGYTAVSYYTDKWAFKRRQSKKASQGGGPKAAAR